MVGVFHVGVSKNRGTSKSSILKNRIFHYKPSIVGYPYFLEKPMYMYEFLVFLFEGTKYETLWIQVPPW